MLYAGIPDASITTPVFPCGGEPAIPSLSAATYSRGPNVLANAARGADLPDGDHLGVRPRHDRCRAGADRQCAEDLAGLPGFRRLEADPRRAGLPAAAAAGGRAGSRSWPMRAAACPSSCTTPPMQRPSRWRPSISKCAWRSCACCEMIQRVACRSIRDASPRSSGRPRRGIAR